MVSAGGAAAVPLPTLPAPAPGCPPRHAGVSPRQLQQHQGSLALHRGAKADAVLGYRGAGEVRTKKLHRSPAGAGLWWCAQRSCHLSLASRKLRTLCRQEQAGCQQPPRANGFWSWQQPCLYPAFHASGAAEFRHVAAQLGSMGE